MKLRSNFLLLLTFTIIMVSACGSRTPQAFDPDAIRTEAVSTYSFSLTATLASLPTIPPTVTSLPTFTPSSVIEPVSNTPQPQSCYNLIWIEDRTIPDGTQMKANQVFTKTWLVQNVGGCAWAPGFTFNHVGGDPMRGRTIVLREPIPVGAKRELSLELVVPVGVSGLIQSSWRMADASGNYFGDTLSVNIIVGESGTPAPSSTP